MSPLIITCLDQETDESEQGIRSHRIDMHWFECEPHGFSKMNTLCKPSQIVITCSNTRRMNKVNVRDRQE